MNGGGELAAAQTELNAPGLGNASARYSSACLLEVAWELPLIAKVHSKLGRKTANLRLMGLAAMAATLLDSASALVSCSNSSECLQAYWEVARLVGRLGQDYPSAAVPTRKTVRFHKHMSYSQAVFQCSVSIMTPDDLPFLVHSTQKL